MAGGRADTAILILERLLPVVSEAERLLASARNWGYLDIMGGGFIVDAVKRIKAAKGRALDGRGKRANGRAFARAKRHRLAG